MRACLRIPHTQTIQKRKQRNGKQKTIASRMKKHSKGCMDNMLTHLFTHLTCFHTQHNTMCILQHTNTLTQTQSNKEKINLLCNSLSGSMGGCPICNLILSIAKLPTLARLHLGWLLGGCFDCSYLLCDGCGGHGGVPWRGHVGASREKQNQQLLLQQHTHTYTHQHTLLITPQQQITTTYHCSIPCNRPLP